jgi:8-hydroxy-5-deazaflavin:NADPH oxidoreductase
MRIGVLGTGMVGSAIATKLVRVGHEVTMGARAPDNENAARWVAEVGEGASQGTFADAAAFGELAFNCTAGTASLEALDVAGGPNLAGKTLVDVANPLDHTRDGPPMALVYDGDSLAEQIQRALPKTRVVKALNTMNCEVMVDPSRVPGGGHDVFVCGDDPSAKEQVVALLRSFGWAPERIVDLGDLTAARGTEAYLRLWLPLRIALGTNDFNIRVEGRPQST